LQTLQDFIEAAIAGDDPTPYGLAFQLDEPAWTLPIPSYFTRNEHPDDIRKKMTLLLSGTGVDRPLFHKYDLLGGQNPNEIPVLVSDYLCPLLF
jgi:hypothetical protein